ncbi:recombinase family protein [Gordonia jacobaea]|uniref:recombinase family protein n=1 Tax=Gordonia jacobaea TaxID=122202 RepID=UPI003D71676A
MTNWRPLRAIVGARVSVVQGPQNVSQLILIETATRLAETKGYEIVESFEDLEVSAMKCLAGRPDLGPWLTEEGSAKWDVIVWSKMDRSFRSTQHCADFARWAEGRQKLVAFADDGLTLDYRVGR